MKDLDPPDEKTVSGGLAPQLEYQPYDEPSPAKGPPNEVDYIPLPVPR